MLVYFQEVFGKLVTVVIDWFQLFIVRLFSLMGQVQTWWDYCISTATQYITVYRYTPPGVILFICKLWGGCVSDRYITER